MMIKFFSGFYHIFFFLAPGVVLTLFIAELLGGNRFATINHCSHKMVLHINMRFELKTDKMNLDPIISFGLRKRSAPV